MGDPVVLDEIVRLQRLAHDRWHRAQKDLRERECADTLRDKKVQATRNHPMSSYATSENNASSGSDSSASPESSSEEPASCRICHEGEEHGRLFSPCLCRGTVGKVHVECLNAWRALSANPNSFYHCDQCGHRYDTRRARCAQWLERQELVQGVTVALLLMLLAAAAAAAQLSRVDVVGRFYQLVYWWPAWKRWGGRWKLMGTVFDSIVEGGVLLGGAGFAAHLALKWRSDARRFGQYVLPGLVVALAQHGMPVIRVRILL
mmetsp:Transcript_50587/g.96601  ORF Transcript_50587/g.96601 Transcript_50587/m.96601 type:complete len:261 (-) Transcript_50587:481-1263(-)